MKLRLIFLVLSLLAFLSAATGGYLYYVSLKKSAFAEAERQAVNRVEIIQKNLSAFLAENVRPIRVLAGMPALAEILSAEDPNAAAVETLLDRFNQALGADVCYLMDRQGVTVASSNRYESDSFVGKNFAFRPYFQQAITGHPATYLALGVTSGKRGAYSSHPVADSAGKIIGVAVAKASLAQVEKELGSGSDEIVLVIDPHGLVFIANQPQWLYHFLWKRTAGEKATLLDSLQFGRGPWPWMGMSPSGGKFAVDGHGESYLLNRMDLNHHPGWQVVHLRSLKAISRIVSDPLLRVTGPTVLTLCILVGLSVFLLYRKASQEIVQRKTVEQALRESEERYRSIYHHTPAMLHSINAEGCLVSVSDHWLEALGYEREKVVGRPLADFLSPKSRHYAVERVIPEFFNSGYCKDIAYQFVKKDGRTMDVLLSAIGDRNQDGKVTRSLAVSIDITERKRAEEGLQKAKEELSRYSRDLERQVKKRTGEIAGKSTVIRTISSMISPRKGTIEFSGRRVDHLPPSMIINEGIVHVPEGRRLSPEMTVEENLIMGSLGDEAKLKRSQTMEHVYDLFPRLKERRKQLAGTLSGGEQQMAAIGRGLMSLPTLMMFDEPSLGLAPILVQDVFKLVRKINDEGVTILLSEQNVIQTLKMCSRAYVLENGRIVLEGTGDELLNNEQVKEAFLGI